MNNIPVFSVETPEAFRDQLVAFKLTLQQRSIDPVKVKRVSCAPSRIPRARYRASKAIRRRRASPTAPTTASTRSVSSMPMATSIPVRWSMVPAQPCLKAGAAQSPSQGKNYLFDALITPNQPAMQASIAMAPDSHNRTARRSHQRCGRSPWPDDRERVDVGTLTINHVESEDTGACRDINYDPLVLPWGIAPSDDPLLSARSAAYARYFKRRAGETNEPSAVTPAEIGQVREGQESNSVYGQRTIHAVLADAALDDGRDDPDDAVHWCRHGRLAGRLPFAGFDPSTAGDCDPDSGHHSLCESEAQPAARVPDQHAARGAARGQRSPKR